MTVDPASATGALTKVGDALKGWPLWLLTGIAACLTLLLTPWFAGLVPVLYAQFAVAAAWILTAAKALSYVPSWLASRRAAKVARTKFVITPVEAQSFWVISKQTDGTFTTQIVIRCMVKNRQSEPMHLMKANVLRPKITGEELPGLLTVQAPDNKMHGTAYVSGFHIPPRSTLPASATLLFRGMPKQRDGKLNVLVEFIDADTNASRAHITLPFASQPGPPYVGLLKRLFGPS